MTVAILSDEAIEFSMDGVTEQFYRDSGAGGQHRNKTDTACRLTHPTGLVICCADERSQWLNRQKAWTEMERRLREQARQIVHAKKNNERVIQMNDRGWTWTEWRDEVVDRSTGKRARYSDLMKGKNFHKFTN